MLEYEQYGYEQLGLFKLKIPRVKSSAIGIAEIRLEKQMKREHT